MKTTYEWYIDPTPDEVTSIWKNGTLTVDANVLLDLYRYHAQTRENLLAAIEGFQQRVWISDQAGLEFFRNRKTVIASAERTFKEATTALEALSSTLSEGVNALRSHRLVPREISDVLNGKLQSGLSEALESVNAAQTGHPNYFQDDDILKRLLRVFDGRLGTPPNEQEYIELIKEGERRKVAKIPPGYMDDDKPGDRPYGDYILWKQALDYARSSSTPMIFVTSETKEDWWEKHSGKRVGPRSELLAEAYERAGQRVLIYQTDFFLQMASKQAGKTVDVAAVEEIRELNASRSPRKVEEAAVRVRQNVDEADIFDNSGILEIELLRPVQWMTGSGAFDPHFESVPEVSVTLVSGPPEAPAIHVRAATGTTFDFNVHVRSAEKGRALPVGIYVVKYRADCWGGFLNDLEAKDA